MALIFSFASAQANPFTRLSRGIANIEEIGKAFVKKPTKAELKELDPNMVDDSDGIQADVTDTSGLALPSELNPGPSYNTILIGKDPASP